MSSGLGRILGRIRYGLPADDYIEPLLARLVDPVVFELGARRGEDTVRLVRYLRAPYQYFAWEPDPRSLPTLRAAASALAGVTIVEAAAGAEDGTAQFHLSSRADGGTFTDASSLLRPTPLMQQVVPWIAFDERVTVHVKTIDRFCADQGIDRIDFIWADVQGAERLVVAGARRMLPRIALLFLEHSADILYEGQWTFDEMMSTLGPRWSIVKRFANDVLLCNRDRIDPPRGADWMRCLRGCWRDLR
ncbi:MAG TPA: FkbM family methyltransferase [Vicinamibacterales bacterium]|nr:FkbM family methyltransferase [Vicinamibacterales bacterium]